jgi:hypothetical protein
VLLVPVVLRAQQMVRAVLVDHLLIAPFLLVAAAGEVMETLALAPLDILLAAAAITERQEPLRLGLLVALVVPPILILVLLPIQVGAAPVPEFLQSTLALVAMDGLPVAVVDQLLRVLVALYQVTAEKA